MNEKSKTGVEQTEFQTTVQRSYGKEVAGLQDDERNAFDCSISMMVNALEVDVFEQSVEMIK